MLIARPQYGLKQHNDTSKGIEAVVMIDVSNSMLARDILPTRLDRAKLLISNMIDKMKNDKIALGVFAGEAILKYLSLRITPQLKYSLMPFQPIWLHCREQIWPQP